MKRIWILAAIIMTLITFYQISTTYAKFVTEINTETQRNVGAWTIKVNNTTISNGVANQNFTINQINYVGTGDEYVVPGKFAPGLEGYFDIKIDATDASVAVRFDIDIDFSLLNFGDDIRFTSIKRVVDGVESDTGIIKTDVNKYTGIILLNEINSDKVVTARFYLKWFENETDEGNNSDSAIGSSGRDAIVMPVNIEVSQYFGEDITQYVEPEPDTDNDA